MSLDWGGTEVPRGNAQSLMRTYCTNPLQLYFSYFVIDWSSRYTMFISIIMHPLLPMHFKYLMT